MADRMSSRTLASFLALLALGLWGRASEAASSNEEIKLGVIPRFASEAAALKACAPDGVVWADDKSGFFYPKFHPDYGRTEHGTYTCYGQAKEADYWSLTPSPEEGRRGREFPMFFCYTCS